MTQFDGNQFSNFQYSQPVPSGPMSAAGERLATPAVRLGAYALELVFLVLTLFIGWAIWWGHMALREFVIKGIVGSIASSITFGIYFIVDSLFVVRDDRKTLHDLISSTQVVQR